MSPGRAPGRVVVSEPGLPMRSSAPCRRPSLAAASDARPRPRLQPSSQSGHRTASVPIVIARAVTRRGKCSPACRGPEPPDRGEAATWAGPGSVKPGPGPEAGRATTTLLSVPVVSEAAGPGLAVAARQPAGHQ